MCNGTSVTVYHADFTPSARPTIAADAESIIGMSAWTSLFQLIWKSFFIRSIVHIVLMSSKKKMFRIKTAPIITVMQNMLGTIQGHSQPEMRREAMRRKFLSLVPCSAITTFLKRTFPIPTPGSFIKSDTIYQWNEFSSHVGLRSLA